MADIPREFTIEQYDAMAPDMETAREAVLALLARHHELGQIHWLGGDDDSVPDPAVKEAFDLYHQAVRLMDRAQHTLVMSLFANGHSPPPGAAVLVVSELQPPKD